MSTDTIIYPHPQQGTIVSLHPLLGAIVLSPLGTIFHSYLCWALMSSHTKHYCSFHLLLGTIIPSHLTLETIVLHHLWLGGSYCSPSTPTGHYCPPLTFWGITAPPLLAKHNFSPILNLSTYVASPLSTNVPHHALLIHMYLFSPLITNIRLFLFSQTLTPGIIFFPLTINSLTPDIFSSH